MSLPFDLEDIVGVALADMLRRAGLIIATVLGSSFLVAFAFGLVSSVMHLAPEALWEALPMGLWLWLAPCLTAWGILYLPTVVAVGFYFVKAESPSVRAFAIFSGLVSILILVSFDDNGAVETWSAAAVVAGTLGALVWLSRIWDNRRRILEREHFMGIVIGNDMRRAQLKDAHGTDIAGSDFVADEDPPERD